MVNRPKNKGTAAESAVVDYLSVNGWPHAERRSLKGALDKGDVTGCPGLCFEVKVGDGGLRLGSWLVETGIERINAGADFGVLAVKPLGLGRKNVASWFAVMLQAEFDKLQTLVTTRMSQWVFHEILEGAEAAGMLTVVNMPVVPYTAGTLRQILGEAQKLKRPWEVPVLTLRPPGMKERPDAWYRVLTLADMARLLRVAGYGVTTDGN